MASSVLSCEVHTAGSLAGAYTRTLVAPGSPSEPGFVLSPGAWTPPAGAACGSGRKRPTLTVPGLINIDEFQKLKYGGTGGRE